MACVRDSRLSLRVVARVVALVLAVALSRSAAFPTPVTAVDDDKAVYNQQLSEERPLQEQIAEADSVKAAVAAADAKALSPAPSPVAVETAEEEAEPDNSDDFTLLKSLAEGQRSQAKETNETPGREGAGRYVPDESDSTKSRRLVEDYDSTKANGMEEGTFPDDPESFRQLDGSPLTARDIVQRIASKVYQEDDRGAFDRIVSKLLRLGLITDSQADTLEYEVAEALQDLITDDARGNQLDDYAVARGNQDAPPRPDTDTESESPNRPYDEEEEEGEDEDRLAVDEDVDREAEGEGDDTADNMWDRGKEEDEEEEEERREEGGEGEEGRREGGEGEERNELSLQDGLQDLQYFPNFYRLLRSLDSEQDAQERETLITIMKTLIDFVKMMVKYGTITPEEGVSYLENLDAMIALQTKNKLGKTLLPPGLAPPTGKSGDEDDNTKAEAFKMQKEYENLKDSTKEEPLPTETSHPGQSETYLEAIRKNIEWLKKHSKDEGKDDYDLSKLRDFMDQQVDSYIEKGIIEKDEGETIKRIYGSL